MTPKTPKTPECPQNNPRFPQNTGNWGIGCHVPLVNSNLQKCLNISYESNEYFSILYSTYFNNLHYYSLHFQPIRILSYPPFSLNSQRGMSISKNPRNQPTPLPPLYPVIRGLIAVLCLTEVYLSKINRKRGLLVS